MDTILYQGLNHAFLDLFGIVPQAQESVDRMGAFIRRHGYGERGPAGRRGK